MTTDCTNHWTKLSWKVWKVKPLPQHDEPAISQMGATPLVSKLSLTVCKPMINDLTSHLVFYFSKQFPNKCMLSISSFQPTSIQHEVNFVNYVSI